MNRSKGTPRRSGRIKMRPLEFWSNQRVVYKAAQGGPILAGVVKCRQFIPIDGIVPVTDNMFGSRKCSSPASFLLLAQQLADLLFPASLDR